MTAPGPSLSMTVGHGECTGGEAGSHGLRGGRDPGGGTGQESHKQMSGGGNQEQEGRGG